MTQQTAIDYSTLENHALNVEVAKRLGLTFRAYDGVEVLVTGQGYASWVYKSWATDANEALGLLDHVVDCDMRRIIDHYHVTIHALKGLDSFHVAHKSLPRAICECWLKWKDATNVSL